MEGNDGEDLGNMVLHGRRRRRRRRIERVDHGAGCDKTGEYERVWGRDVVEHALMKREASVTAKKEDVKEVTEIVGILTRGEEWLHAEEGDMKALTQDRSSS